MNEDRVRMENYVIPRGLSCLNNSVFLFRMTKYNTSVVEFCHFGFHMSPKDKNPVV